MVMIYALGHVSGAHFNPAVTLAVFVRGGGKIDLGSAAVYVLSQLAGGFVGGATVAFVPLSATPGYPAPGLGTSSAAALVVEVLYTFALCTVVLNVATTKAQENNSFFGLAIGATVCASAFAGGGISGGAFNPAVGTALPFIAGELGSIWLYWVGPLTGGALAGALFHVTASADEF